MKKIISLLSAAVIAALCLVPAQIGYCEEDFFPNCKAGIVYEATTDTVVFEKNADEALIPASMTKVMTAIITLEHNPNLEGELKVAPKSVSDYYCSYKEIPHLVADETISYEQCVEYMLLISANEAASALSFAVCEGGRDAFVQEMNDKAVELGCENTHFLDPHGLSPSNTVSPRDMVKIAKYAMTFPKLREILTHYSGVVKANDLRKKDIEYYSLLAPMWPDTRYTNPCTPYLTGVKTGWIPQSGYNYACSMEKDGLEYYIVVMGGDDVEDKGETYQGDFYDVVNHVLPQIENLTAEDLHKMNNSFWWIYLVVGVVAGSVATILIRNASRRKKERQNDN